MSDELRQKCSVGRAELPCLRAVRYPERPKMDWRIVRLGILGACCIAWLPGCGGSGDGDLNDSGAGGGSASAGEAGRNTGSGGTASAQGGRRTASGGQRTGLGGTSAGSGGANSSSSGRAGGGGAPPSPIDGPAPGNPDGNCAIPAGVELEDISEPRSVVGTGTASSCTGAAFVQAVSKGGVITFDCGPDPVTITLDTTAKVVNDTGPKIVIDGGNKVTLSGGGKVRILYQNTCDENQKHTTSHCQDQETPQLTLQNLTFIEGNSAGQTLEEQGGGAVFARGGRLKIVNSRFFKNVCNDTGPDLGGAAVRALSQWKGLPVYVVNSTFGGAPELGNVCSNGGGLSSIGVSYTVINSLFSYNRAIGQGANPAKSGTPGGGSGGAIYNDGNTFTLTLCGTRIENNSAKEGGGAIFFVSNDRTGTLRIQDSVLSNNPSQGFETRGYPGIFVLAKGVPEVQDATIE